MARTVPVLQGRLRETTGFAQVHRAWVTEPAIKARGDCPPTDGTTCHKAKPHLQLGFDNRIVLKLG